MDPTLPGLSGAALFEQIRRIRRDVKVILTSAYDAEAAARLVTQGSIWSLFVNLIGSPTFYSESRRLSSQTVLWDPVEVRRGFLYSYRRNAPSQFSITWISG